MAYHQTDIDERRKAIATRFLEGEFSETVLSASLFATGLRSDELESTVRDILNIAGTMGIEGARHDAYRHQTRNSFLFA